MKHVTVRNILFLFVFFCFISDVNPQQMQGQLIPKRGKYFHKICRLLKANYYYIDTVNFDSYVESYKKKFLKAVDDETAYEVLRDMLFSLKGNHCGFLSPSDVSRIMSPAEPVSPKGRMLDGSIALVEVPGCMLNENLVMAYVDSMQRVIMQLDAHRPAGWIFDLRKNNGGSASAMLAALSSFFNDGVIYTLEDRQGTASVSKIEQGVYKEFREKKLVYSFSPVHQIALRNKAVPVALLTSRHTASAAEILTIAFKSLPNAKTFGEATAGLPTGNVSFLLSDGSQMYITRSIISDVHGIKYTGSIAPDVLIDDQKDDDALFYAVRKWMQTAKAAEIKYP